MANFYQNNYIHPEENLDLSENLKVNDFMCGHCYRIKMSNDLIKALTKLKKEYPKPFYVVLGYQCEDYCRENGENPNNSHTKGFAADVHFGANVPVLEILDVVEKIFDYVGVVRAATGEYYLHLQVANTSLYWVEAITDNPKNEEYIYFSDYTKLRNFIASKPDIFGEVKI